MDSFRLHEHITVLTVARMPRRPLCSTDPKQCGSWREPQARALARPYVQFNPAGVTGWLLYDVDRPGGGRAWEAEGLPPPAWSCTTRANGHGHLAWGLERPVVGRDYSTKSVRFLEAVREGFRRRLQADGGYAGVLTKNPLSEDWIVAPGLQKLWDLQELGEWVKLPNWRPGIGREPGGGLGRNCDTFDRLRFWAYAHVSAARRSGGLDDWYAVLAARAERLDAQHNMPQLGWNELKHIVRSVSRWTWENYDGGGGQRSDFFREMGRRGGRPRTTPSLGEPWLAAGISRATWYRRQKSEGGTP